MNAETNPLQAILAGDRRAVARAITALENDSDSAHTVRAGVAAHVGRAHVVGVTGPPGGGKSTLVSGLIRQLRVRGHTVAVGLCGEFSRTSRVRSPKAARSWLRSSRPVAARRSC